MAAEEAGESEDEAAWSDTGSVVDAGEDPDMRDVLLTPESNGIAMAAARSASAAASPLMLFGEDRALTEGVSVPPQPELPDPQEVAEVRAEEVKAAVDEPEVENGKTVAEEGKRAGEEQGEAKGEETRADTHANEHRTLSEPTSAKSGQLARMPSLLRRRDTLPDEDPAAVPLLPDDGGSERLQPPGEASRSPSVRSPGSGRVRSSTFDDQDKFEVESDGTRARGTQTPTKTAVLRESVDGRASRKAAERRLVSVPRGPLIAVMSLLVLAVSVALVLFEFEVTVRRREWGAGVVLDDEAGDVLVDTADAAVHVDEL